MANKKTKKKNVRVRRTVKRTVAALLMIMAIVVASIPVENYGTMEAKTELKGNLSIDNIYEAYMNYNPDFSFNVSGYDDATSYNTTDYDSASTKYLTAGLRKLNSGKAGFSLLKEYKVIPRTGHANQGIIVGLDSSYFRSSLDIKNDMYYQYWVITTEFIKKFTDKISSGGENFAVKVKDSGSEGATSYSITVDGGSGGTLTVPAQLVSVTDTAKKSHTGGSFEVQDIEPYKDGSYSSMGTPITITYSTEDDDAYFFDNFFAEDGDYKSYMEDIKNYNNKVKDILSLLGDNRTITTDQATYDSYKTQVDDLRTLYNNLLTTHAFERSATEVVNRLNSDSINLNKYFCRRVKLKTRAGAAYDLNGFTLLEVDDQYDSFSGAAKKVYSYVPQWQKIDASKSYKDDLYAKDGAELRSECLDENGFIANGKITVYGVGNNVFDGQTSLSDVTLDDQIAFIGNEAFKGCTSITKISFQNCRLIGNRAFEGCTSLTTVEFRDDASSLQQIGAKAFADTKTLKEINLPRSITDIGQAAFYSSGLERFHIPSQTSGIVTLWPFAFCNCNNLKTIEEAASDDSTCFPNNTEISIGMGAFSLLNTDNGNMEEFHFPDQMTKIIGTNSSDFKKSSGDTLYDSAKAVRNDVDSMTFGNLSSATQYFTKNNKEIWYDYILAGRSKLDKVYFPKRMSDDVSPTRTPEKIPDNTLMGCSLLSVAIMGEKSFIGPSCNNITYDAPDLIPASGATVEYDTDQDGETLFQDITNPDFCVHGPGYFNSDATAPTTPRRITWMTQSKYADNIPYCYIDGNNNECIEIATGKEGFIASIVVLDEAAKTAKLTSFFNPQDPDGTSNTKIRELVIPAKVGEYSIVEVGKGCFKPVKNQVVEFTIEDGTIEDLEEGAFAESTSLLQVNIGNSVKTIGAGAFKNCTKLENIYFSDPIGVNDSSSEEEWKNVLTIGEDAFRTNSEYLTIHGPAHSGYEPFEFAMDDNTIGTSKRNICYKVNRPYNLTVIRDKVTGLATCIDYPHYEDIDKDNEKLIYEMIDRIIENHTKQGLGTYEGPGSGVGADPQPYSIMLKWENSQNFKTNSDYDGMDLEEEEEDAVKGTIFINFPEGIESIATKEFFTSTENRVNWPYFTRYYKEDDKSASHVNDTCIEGTNDTNYDRRNINYATDGSPSQYLDVSKLYSDDSTIKAEYEADGNAGLFSGYFNESKEDDANLKIWPKSYTNLRNTNISYTDTDAHKEYWKMGLIGQKFKYNGYNHDMIETNPVGNDNILSVSLGSIKELPDHAFDNCENLINVSIGKLETCGFAPFKDCVSIETINTEGNDNFVYANGIFYGVNEDGTYTLIECLPSRGDSVEGKNISLKNDPLLEKVTAIKEEAFMNCPNITSVDLKETTIPAIPRKCFANCSKLREVILPDTLSSIEEQAFVDDTNLSMVTFYTPYVTIKDDSFKNCNVTFYGNKYSDEAKTHESPIYTYYWNHGGKTNSEPIIDFVEMTQNYTVRFFDYDATLLKVQIVPEGENATPPEEEPTRTSYTFDGWAWDKDGDLSTGDDIVKGDEVLKDIKESRVIIAQYKLNGGGETDGKYYDLNMVSCTANNQTDNPLSVLSGSIVNIVADKPNTGYRFAYWSCDAEVNFTSLYYENTTFLMPMQNCTVTAHYVDGQGNEEQGTTFTVTVKNGAGSGTYHYGDTVAIGAFAPADNNQIFSTWTTATEGVGFASATSATTSFIMPKKDVTVEATYVERGSGSGSGSGSGNSDSTKKGEYTLTVNYGSGSGKYDAGEVVSISAYAPDTSTKVFSHWTTTTSNVAFSSTSSANTTIVMPKSDATVTANYKTRSKDDDDDDDDKTSLKDRHTSTAVANNPGNTNQNNTGTGNNNGNNQGNNGNNGNNTDTAQDTGNRLDISKNGISNKDLGSVSVDGSTDNFVVKITDSDEARQAVEAALIAKYGSLDGIKYFPMDITLYDATGKNKITDTEGLRVNITIPIPDDMVGYGGNNQAGAVSNGAMEDLAQRFTTIDGVACISFTATHFSPYAIYVDTNNLIASQMMDATPQTGDFIHPKWFLAMALACVSVTLFILSDNKKKLRIRKA